MWFKQRVGIATMAEKAIDLIFEHLVRNTILVCIQFKNNHQNEHNRMSTAVVFALVIASIAAIILLTSRWKLNAFISLILKVL